jgi:hypothetical protein
MFSNASLRKTPPHYEVLGPTTTTSTSTSHYQTDKTPFKRRSDPLTPPLPVLVSNTHPSQRASTTIISCPSTFPSSRSYTSTTLTRNLPSGSARLNNPSHSPSSRS